MDEAAASGGAAGGQAAISVIVCTYNRASSLERTLGALAQQTVPADHMEVIVVDDGSTDGTPAVCAGAAARMPNLRCAAHDRNRNLAAARNTGLAMAQGRFILFTDDDCIPAPNWAERMAAALEREPIVAGAVDARPTSYAEACHQAAHFHGFTPDHRAGCVPLVTGANMGFRKDVLEALGGFRQVMPTSEDVEMSWRARSFGYRLPFAPDVVVLHAPQDISLARLFHYAAQHGASSIVLRGIYRNVVRMPLILRSWPLLAIGAPLVALAATVRVYLTSRWAARNWATLPVVFMLKVAWCVGAVRQLRRVRQPLEAAWETSATSP